MTDKIKDNVTLVTECEACEASARAVFESRNEDFELERSFYEDILHEWMVDAGLIYPSDNDAQTLRYSVGFCQGDGASFELIPTIDMEPSTEELERERAIHTLREDHILVYLAIQELDARVSVKFYGGSRYVHENTMDAEWGYVQPEPDELTEDAAIEHAGIYNGMRLKDLAAQVTEEMIEEYANDLLDLCRNKAQEIHHMMEEEVMYQSSEEAFKEFVANCDDEFDLCDTHAEERDAIEHYLVMQRELDLTVQM